MTSLLQRRPDLVASLAVAVASVLWGLYWIPVRYLGAAGLPGGWPGLALFGVAALLMLPGIWLRRERLLRAGIGLALTGLMTGAGFSLYSASLLLTDVVRVLLLFYLTPVWSTLLGALLLGERITLARAAALMLGISGLLVVLGADQGIPLPRDWGDWLALASGIFWAYGSLRLFRETETAAYEQVFGFFAGGALVSGLVVCLPIAALGIAPDPQLLLATAPQIGLIALLFLLPTGMLTLGGARHLSPGRVGILLMGEAVVGIASAALLTDEPFGPREMLGTVLVLGAAGVELLQKQPRPPASKAAGAREP